LSGKFVKESDANQTDDKQYLYCYNIREMRMKQQSFSGFRAISLEHGGSNILSHAKVARPLHRKKWHLITLKSERARGKWCFKKHERLVTSILEKQAKKFGVRIGDFANVKDHLHLKVKIHNRFLFQAFLKSSMCLIARKITGAKNGNPVGRFWQGLAHSRVLMTAFEELRVRGYIAANRVQATAGYGAREDYLRDFNDWVRTLRSGTPKGII
jgi:REP element-mobilizing transposase RayT